MTDKTGKSNCKNKSKSKRRSFRFAQDDNSMVMFERAEQQCGVKQIRSLAWRGSANKEASKAPTLSTRYGKELKKEI